MTNRVGGPQGLSLVFGTSEFPGAYPAGPAPIEAFLWRGALDTLSSLPLASADPFGGIIITDWYTRPGDTAERFKATVYMEGPQPDVTVSVFRQVNRGGRWVDAPASAASRDDLRNRILFRARQLREVSG